MGHTGGRDTPIGLQKARLNRTAYEAGHRERLERDDFGRIAFLHDEELVDIFDDLEAANNAGYEQFGEGNFSLIRIGRNIIDFGSMNRFVG